MRLILSRRAYMSDRTMGELHIGNERFPTLERPWIQSMEHMGGKNFESCIPEGNYEIRPFSSDAHPDSFSLANSALDVWVVKPQDPGRWAILLHTGNYIKDIVGCIAPGISGDDHNVWKSKKAMKRIRELLAGEDVHTITIKSRGTPQ